MQFEFERQAVLKFCGFTVDGAGFPAGHFLNHTDTLFVDAVAYTLSNLDVGNAAVFLDDKLYNGFSSNAAISGFIGIIQILKNKFV